MRLFSYVVEHDQGFAPNPFYGVCTLEHVSLRWIHLSQKNVLAFKE
ncbi:hypothetical protein [Acuticoccus sediminis]|nr:hypothetical protein [Acuticoccus sediminis]